MNKKLAIQGGTPRFSKPLHVGHPNMGDYAKFDARMKDLWNRNWLTNNGPYVQEFEATIAERLGVGHCIAVCNGTVGLEIAVRALELSGEVIVPSFTFIATAHAVRWQRLTPVFCDVHPETHNINPESARSLITPKTSAILAVNLWGKPCDLDSLQALADEHHLKLLYDSSHAFNNEFSGQKLGNFGNAEVFSFHATKFINAFEGGVVTTNDDALSKTMRLIRNFGFADYDEVSHLGTNGKMTEVCAAMGLTSLESIDKIIAHNRRNHHLYSDRLNAIEGLTVLHGPESSNHQYVVVEVAQQEFGLSRDDLIKVLQAENILARRYFYSGCHRQEPYRSEPTSIRCDLSVTEQLCERVMQLPTGFAIGPQDIESICEIILLAQSELSVDSK